MTEQNFQRLYVILLLNGAKKRDIIIFPEDVYIVRMCKTLQNNKALAAASIENDTKYFEIAHNGEMDFLTLIPFPASLRSNLETKV